MAYGYFIDLAKRTASDKVLRNKTFNITKNPKYGGYQRGLASMVCKYFDKKSIGSDAAALANNGCHLDLARQQSADELRKAVIKKF